MGIIFELLQDYWKQITPVVGEFIKNEHCLAFFVWLGFIHIRKTNRLMYDLNLLIIAVPDGMIVCFIVEMTA